MVLRTVTALAVFKVYAPPAFVLPLLLQYQMPTATLLNENCTRTRAGQIQDTVLSVDKAPPFVEHSCSEPEH